MHLHKRKVFLILLNFLCLATFVWFVVSFINTVLLVGNSNVLTSILSCLLFLVPYFCFILFSVLIFKNQYFSHSKDGTLVRCLLVAISVVCLVIAVFYLNNNISSLISAIDAIDGIKNGSIYSNLYTQSQLLRLQKELIAHNVCLICSNSIFLISYICSATILFKKTIEFQEFHQ